MFTGLIEETGRLVAVRADAGPPQLQIAAPRLSSQSEIGDSVAVNGCCLTVTSRQAGELTFDLLEETLQRTNLKTLRPGSLVNLERALAADGRLGGHFVQGHIDCAARILGWEENGTDLLVRIELPAEFAHYVALKGSIAVDGISLTVAEVTRESFAVWVIPHTRAQTNLAAPKSGDLVNLEFDLIAKYLERMLDSQVVRPA